jgi:hypothetical protein
MEWYLLVLGSLGVWRVTHILSAEDGPWNVLARLRAAAGRGPLGDMLDCFNCLSLWVSIPFAILLGAGWRQMMLLWLALSGAAILLQRLTDNPMPASYIEDQPPPPTE